MPKRTLVVLVSLSLSHPALADAERTIGQVCAEAKVIFDQQPRQVRDVLATLCADHWDE